MKTAAREGVPIQCVVNIDEFRTRSLVDQWYAEASDVAGLCFVSQIVEYSTAYRAEAAERLAKLVKTNTHDALERERASFDHTSSGRDVRKACPVQTRRKSVLEQAAASHILEQTGKEKGGLQALAHSSDGLLLWRFCIAVWLIIALNWTALINRINQNVHGWELKKI